MICMVMFQSGAAIGSMDPIIQRVLVLIQMDLAQAQNVFYAVARGSTALVGVDQQDAIGTRQRSATLAADFVLSP